MILLDEANLSPMEYYWADFMNICDDIDYTSIINLPNQSSKTPLSGIPGSGVLHIVPYHKATC